MEVEIVKFDKNNLNSMETIILKKFYNTDHANEYYANWMCEEYYNNNVLVLGKNWNKADKTEIKVPEEYKYKHTYSVNLWDLIYNDITNSHNFTVYTC